MTTGPYIQGQGAEDQQLCRHCSGQQGHPASQGEKVDEGLHDKGLTDCKEHQQEDCRPEIVGQVIECYQPHVGRRDCNGPD